MLIARGRDAADVAISTSFGPSVPDIVNVTTHEVSEGAPAMSASTKVPDGAGDVITAIVACRIPRLSATRALDNKRPGFHSGHPPRRMRPCDC